MKIEWDLSHFYTSENDSRIERDVRATENAYAAFEKKYRGKNFTAPRKLLGALKEYEKLSERVSSARPLMYFSYRRELNAKDTYADQQLQLIGDRYTKAGNKITFFELALGKIPIKTQKKLLSDKKFAPYKYFLERIFLTAKHNLTEAEEKLLSLLSSPSGGLWIDGVDKALSKRALLFKGKQIALNEALMSVGHLKNQKDRHALWKKALQSIKEVSEFSESEINAIYTKKKVTDELRKFKEPFEATVLGYENDLQSVQTLVKAVSAAFPIAHRFYRAKKKLLNLETFTYADRGAPLPGVTIKYPFESAVDAVRGAFNKLHPRYGNVLDSFLENGQIDALPREGKSGGAFCSGSHANPTLVLLNHTNDFNSVMTLAHEMGHAIHTERSHATQPILYEDYSTAVAETASTFFEGHVFHALTKNLTKEERVLLLHNRIQDDISTVFRQIACFNFEKELHYLVRTKGWVPKEEIAELLNLHMKSYLGNAVQLSPDDGYFFVSWSHIRRPFYVYSYAFGQLVSKALLTRVEKDPTYIEKVDQFLKAGRSTTPESIFKAIGVDLRTDMVFKEGLRSIERDIAELERLIT